VPPPARGAGPDPGAVLAPVRARPPRRRLRHRCADARLRPRHRRRRLLAPARRGAPGLAAPCLPPPVRWRPMTAVPEVQAQAPVVRPLRIRAGKRSLLVELREVWDYRELLGFLVWRDI